MALLAVAYALIIVMAFYWRGACFGALNLLAADIAVLALPASICIILGAWLRKNVD